MQKLEKHITNEAKIPEPRASRRPSWRSAFEVVAYLALAVFLLEVLFRIAGVGSQEFMYFDQKLGNKHIPGKEVIWRLEGFSAETLNSHGYRDVEHAVAKPAGIKRVAVLGDSHSEGLQVPLNNTYARRLEASLNGSANKTADKTGYEVINFACSGYSTAQEYVQFSEEVAPYKPDVTVILMHWGNTAANIVDSKNRRNAQPRPYFYLDSEGRLLEDNSIAEWCYKQDAQNEGLIETIGFLKRHSRIYGVLCQTDLALSINERLYSKLRSFIKSASISLQGKDYKAEPPGPVYPPQDSIRVTQKIVMALSKKCAENDSKLVIMLLPDVFGVSAKFSKDLTDLSSQHNFGLLDLSDAFKKHPNPNDVFLRVHLSSQGHKFVADTLHAFLQQKNYLQ
ncbi:MAG: SGNH/GDSL hydrolase family protein [Leptolyngbya sp.]|nr:SGNH/GDSL hydrolase family protein [Candidatus Melainabacteria bacterium]